MTATTATAPPIRRPSWLGMGVDLSGVQSLDTALARAGLNFDVEQWEAGYRNPATGEWHTADHRTALVREQGRVKPELFDYVSPGYQRVTYQEAFGLLEQISPQYVSGGSYRGGREGFLVVKFPNLARLDLNLRGNPDRFEFHAVVRTSQDGQRSVEIALCSLRGPCTNQLTLPNLIGGSGRQTWSIRHTKTVRDRMHEAQLSLKRTGDYVDAFAEMARRLADIDVSDHRVRSLLAYVMPDRSRQAQQIDEIMDVYRNSPTNGFYSTGWGVINAISEYLEWERPSAARQTPTALFLNVLDGNIHKTMAKATRAVLALAS